MKTIKFDLSTTFKKVPEGERVLTITSCEATPSGNPSAIKLVWSDVEGGVIAETINFDNALWKVSQICSYALNISDGDEMLVSDMCKQLVGKKLKCEVIHRQGSKPKEDGTFVTFANVNKILGKGDDETTITVAQNTNPRDTILAGL